MVLAQGIAGQVRNDSDDAGFARSDISLHEVEVVASRAGEKTPVAYSNMDKQAIEAANFGQDIPFLLLLTPSVIATSDAGTGIGYTGFRIRGTDANRINITSNGIPLNDSESHGVFWVNMPDFASSLQDLQVQRGVGTSTNGAGAFGASINMKTENVPLKSYGEFDGGLGSFNTQKATFKLGTGILNDHWAFDGRLSSITSDGFIDRAAVDLKSYFAQGAYFNDHSLVKFITFGGKEKTYHAWDGVSDYKLAEGNRTYNPSGYMGEDADGNELFYANQTDNYEQTHYQLSLLQRLNLNLNLNVALHYTKGQGYYEEYKDNRALEEYGLQAGESDLIREKWLDNDFYGGIFSLDYIQNKWNVSLGGGANKYEGNHFGYVKWVKDYTGDADFQPNHEYYRSTGDKTDANIYLKANYQLTNELSLYGDAQYRYIDYQIQGKNDVWDWNIGEMQNLNVHDKFNFFNPKVGLFYQINKENNVYASFAIANREPNRNNYTNANINEIPKPERLQDYELGYKFNNRTFSAGVNLYYMDYKDQLVLTGKVNEIGEPLTSNVPESYRMGAELVLGARITSWLKWNGNLTLSSNEIKSYTEYIDEYDENWEWMRQVENALGTTPIAFSPNVTAGSLFAVSLKNWDGGLQSNFVGKQYIDNTGSDARSLDAYFVNNLRLGYTFHLKGVKSLALNVLVNNLFNAQYESNAWVYSSYQQGTRNEDFGYFPQAGTNFMANVVVKF
ncbi:TonB-dependent receptor [Candidatus Symbiothrix dinenymphae]|uniref:TonB-dependent receptor n=1 Tax=Candidatus Symbiothrix dinenymphae TaxID=467085 RepID=UPI003B969E22